MTKLQNPHIDVRRRLTVAAVLVILALTAFVAVPVSRNAFDALWPWPPAQGTSVSSEDAAEMVRVGDGDELAKAGYAPLEYDSGVDLLPIRDKVPPGQATIWTACAVTACPATPEQPYLIVSTFYDAVADKYTNVILVGAIAQTEEGMLHCSVPWHKVADVSDTMEAAYDTLRPGKFNGRAYAGSMWACIGYQR